MADVILIQPSIREFQVFKKIPDLPLSLLSIASFLNENYDVKIIDQRLDQNWKSELLKGLETNPICVGLTATTGEEIINALKASKIVKTYNSLTKVVWGGSHASLLPRQTLENPYIDIVVKGEGEETFYELVKALKKGKSLKGIRGVWYKQNGKIYGNPDRPFIDLNKIPPLPYNLINMKNYSPRKDGKKSVYVETSRGCPNHCAFCYNSISKGHIYRSLSPTNTIRKIKWLVDNYGIEHLVIIDDNYFVNKKRTINISKQIIRDKLDIEWTAVGADINIVSRFSVDELKMLKRSGCNKLYFGVESGSQRIPDLINKNTTVKQIIDLNHLLKKVQIRPFYYFVYGFPSETISELKETSTLMLTLLKDNPSASIGAFCYTPIPNTPLFKLALKEGFKPPRTLEEWSKYDRDITYKRFNSTFVLSFVIKNSFRRKFSGNKPSEKFLWYICSMFRRFI